MKKEKDEIDVKPTLTNILPLESAKGMLKMNILAHCLISEYKKIRSISSAEITIKGGGEF